MTTSAIEDVAIERQRQIECEGWTPQHDDHHDSGALAMAAALYAAPEPLYKVQVGTGAVQWLDPWPFKVRAHVRHDLDVWVNDGDGREKHDHRRRLVIAGALVVAEIERLDRLAQAIETRRAETEGLGAKHESAVPKGCAPTTQPSPESTQP